MPTLPVYNSQRNITANVAATMRDEAAQPFQDQQKMIGAAQTVAQKWSDANDVMQYTEAKAKYETAAAGIEARANADTNFRNTEQYYKELEKAKTESLVGIDNQEVAQKAGLDFDFNNRLTGIKIQAQFRQKQMDFNKVNVKNNLGILQQKQLSAATPVEAAQYDHQIEQLLQANVDSGVLTYAEADKELRDAQLSGVKYQIYADTATEEKDSQILKELKANDGKYSFLDPDDRLKLIEESQRRIFQNNQTYKRLDETEKNERFNEIFQKANDGTLTLNDLDNEEKVAQAGVVGALDQKEILEIRKGIQSRTKSDLETIIKSDHKAADYLDFVDNFIDDETDRQKGREAILSAFKDGILSPKEAAFLNSLKRETEDVQWSRTKEGMSTNNLIPFKNAYFAVREWFRGTGRHNEKDAAIAIKKLLSGAANNADLQEATQQIISDDRVQQQPDIKSYPETGQLMVDPVTGVKAIVFPDGRVEIQK